MELVKVSTSQVVPENIDVNACAVASLLTEIPNVSPGMIMGRKMTRRHSTRDVGKLGKFK